MKQLNKIVLSIVLITGFAFVQTNEFSKLYMLQGAWSMKTQKGSVGEIWQRVNDNHLQSKAYFVRGSDTSYYEKVALEKKADDIFYTVTSTNQNDGKPVAFKLTSSANSKFVFENPEHDFPQRIVYELVNKDSVHAFIDNGEGIKTNHFYFSRTKE